MTEKELRRLNRMELLELLLHASEENARLNEEVKELRSQLEKREIILEQSGSIAQAAMELNHIFEVAQKTADEYLENVQKLAERKKCELEEEKNQEREG